MAIFKSEVDHEAWRLNCRLLNLALFIDGSIEGSIDRLIERSLDMSREP